jgi:hypothetical protein
VPVIFHNRHHSKPINNEDFYFACRDFFSHGVYNIPACLLFALSIFERYQKSEQGSALPHKFVSVENKVFKMSFFCSKNF